MGDILIQGMEMPTEGGTICIYKIRGEFFAARAGKDELFPIVPVPPHGDLVDRDETIEAGKSHPTYKNNKIVRTVVDKACCFLKTATVVIPANKEY